MSAPGKIALSHRCNLLVHGVVVLKFDLIEKRGQITELIAPYKKIGYSIDVLRQTSCLVVNPIKVNINSFAYLFNYTTVKSGFRLNDGTIINLTSNTGGW